MNFTNPIMDKPKSLRKAHYLSAVHSTKAPTKIQSILSVLENAFDLNGAPYIALLINPKPLDFEALGQTFCRLEKKLQTLWSFLKLKTKGTTQQTPESSHPDKLTVQSLEQQRTTTKTWTGLYLSGRSASKETLLA